MKQSYENRGKIAFVQDQAAAAAEAFKEGDFVGCTTILEGVANFIEAFLTEASKEGK